MKTVLSDIQKLEARVASVELTPEAIKNLISEWIKIEHSVQKLSKLYEKHDFNEHDLGFAPKIIPMSLDEWHIEIRKYIEDWKKEMDLALGRGSD